MTDLDVLTEFFTSHTSVTADSATNVPVVSPVPANASACRPFALAVDRMTPDQAGLTREVGRGVTLPLPAQGAWLKLEPATSGVFDPSLALALEGDFDTIEVDDGDRFLRALTGIDTGGADGGMEADAVRREWLEAQIVARLQGTPFSSTQRIVRSSSTEKEDASVLRMTIGTAGHGVTVLARSDAGNWIRFLQQDEWQRAALPPARFAALPFETVIRVARHSLPDHAMAALRPGDIIVPDNAVFGTRGEGYVQLGVLRAQVDFVEPNTFRINEVAVALDALELDRDAHDGTRLTPGNADAGGEDGIPLDLDFELGTVRMSLDELQALGPESLVAFRGSPAAIAIRCARRLVGRGALVDASGRLGVRVMEWSA